MELISLYSTPIWITEFNEFEEKKDIFISAIKEYKQACEEQGIRDEISNVGGYESPKHLHAMPQFEPLLNFICQSVVQCCDELNFVPAKIFISKTWANINDSRQAMIPPKVGDGVFSGIFYVKVPENSGKLCISNSSMNPLWGGHKLIDKKNNFTSRLTKITPEEGQIYIWPSYISSYVETNNHDDEYISISFEIIPIDAEEIADQ